MREIAILVTGAHFRSAYELYAHVIVAENRGLDDAKLATIVAGQRPSDLTREELSPTTSLRLWSAAACCRNSRIVQRLGHLGSAAELMQLVGLYCMVSVTINAFDVPVPEADA